MSGSTKVGIVKQVVSGDTIIVRGQPRNGPPPEATLILSNISAPKLAKRPTGNDETKDDEPYAWEAREFLRKKLIGENVSFTSEKPQNATREYNYVYFGKDEENINETLVKEGLVTARGSPLRDLEEHAKTAGKGKYNKASKDEDHIRDIKWNVSIEMLQALIDKYQGKPVKAIVEHVRDGSTVRCFIQDENKTFYYITLMIAGIKCPGYKMEGGKPGAPEPLTEEAKFVVESRLLQRDVEITLDSISGSNVVGSILHPKGNIAELLLQEGYAKCLDWTMKFVKNAETFRKYEKIAKEKRLKLWKDWKPTTPQLSGVEKEYQATVVEVSNGDALIVKLANGSHEKVFLSSIRPPRLAGEENKEGAPPRQKTPRPLYDIPWMFEAREFLRKKLIGKKVNVVVDYIQPAKDQFPKKTCCTVTIAGVNVAEAMVLKGLATVVKHRSDDDQRSSHYDSLASAEAKAIKNQKGLHSKKDIPVHRIVDYSSDSKKVKDIFPHLKRSSARTEALVEFVFSGSRLRLFIAKDSCLITLLLAGISCPRVARQTPVGNASMEGDPFGEEALKFTKEKCFQREVEISLENVDKAGNFIGWLWVDNINLSVALVQEGLSEVHFSAERSEHHRALMDAQNSAKSKKLNRWKNFVEEEDKDKQKDEEEMITERKVNHQKVFVIEITEELHIFIQLEDQGPKLESMLAKMRLELANVTIGAYTPKKGDVCAAKFAMDDQWYRARVEKVTGNKVKVFYIDYGNRDEIPSTLCAALPADFASEKPFAVEYGLAFVKFGGDAEDKQVAIDVLKDDLLNRSVLLNVEYRFNGLPFVTLYDPEKTDTDIVKPFVEEGYLLLDKRNDKRLQKLVEEYKAAQEKALKGHKALWRYGDITEDDDKEFGLGR
ncbi:staphylococcal nuclease domain-containing protein 1 [Lycorma delicatula]|uniref:staphylococcal nuclease domain-containing protein 1 n=1 Tax=Lycorma delicatula TaxID=130591 RepID=UPI003F50ECEE